MTPERLRVALNTGIVVVNQIRVTDDKGKLLASNLRLVMMDRATGKNGSVRISLH